jgi:hypothetical protein
MNLLYLCDLNEKFWSYLKGTSINPFFTLKQGQKRMGFTLKVPGAGALKTQFLEVPLSSKTQGIGLKGKKTDFLEIEARHLLSRI